MKKTIADVIFEEGQEQGELTKARVVKCPAATQIPSWVPTSLARFRILLFLLGSGHRSSKKNPSFLVLTPASDN